MNDSQAALSHELAAEGLAAFVAEADRPVVADMLMRLQRVVRVLEAGGAEEARAWARRNPLPTVLMVDFSGEAHPLQALAELAAAYGPTVHIIVLGERQDVDLYRRLLQAGALDYLVKPLSLDLLASTLERAAHGVPLGMGERLPRGRTVAITGAGGGAGCSTIAAALGQLIAGQRQTPCVLVDFDRSKGDLPMLLGTEADAGLAALLAAPEIDPRMLQRSMHSLPAALSGGVPQRLHLLAQRPAAHLPVDPERVLELGAALTQLFSLVIWDMPACHTEGVAEVLDHADVRVVLFELSVQCARHVHRLVQRFGDERSGQRLLLVLNPTRPTGTAQLTQAQFEEFIGRQVDLVLPHAGSHLADSLLKGPLAPASHPAFAQALLGLADKLLGRKPQAAIAAKTGWLQKLLRTTADRHSYS